SDGLDIASRESAKGAVLNLTFNTGSDGSEAVDESDSSGTSDNTDGADSSGVDAEAQAAADAKAAAAIKAAAEAKTIADAKEAGAAQARAWADSKVAAAAAAAAGSSAQSDETNEGRTLYAQQCAGCHGSDPASGRRKIYRGVNADKTLSEHSGFSRATAEKIAAYLNSVLNGSSTAVTPAEAAAKAVEAAEAKAVAEAKEAEASEARAIADTKAAEAKAFGYISDDLVVHLPLDGDTGDSSLFDNNGSTSGAISYSAGKLNQGINTDAGEYVSFGTSANLNFGANTDFSVAFWVKSTGWTSDPSLISNKNWKSGSNQGWVIAAEDDGSHWQWNFKGASGSRADYENGGTINDGQWHHITVTHDRDGNAVFYHDGVPVGSVSIVGQGSVDSGLPTALNADGTLTYNDDFSYDDLKIWRRVVTASEIQTLYSDANGNGSSGTGRKNKVIVIGVDGMRADRFAAVNTPNLDRLIANGVFDDNTTLTSGPSMSGVGWSDITTGVKIGKHQVTGNHITPNALATYPSFIDRLERVDSNINTASFLAWKPIRGIVQTPDFEQLGEGSNEALDADVAQKAANYIATSNPDAIFVHFDNVDHVAHSYGGLSQEYDQAINNVDSDIGVILAAIQGRATYAEENWLIMIASDHGSRKSGGHGGSSLEETTVFYLASGPSTSMGTLIDGGANTRYAATALQHVLGYTDPAWNLDGEPLGLVSDAAADAQAA
ncbi:MAG: alkaline phosphatase family protein, partial [Sedimenticola sp.]